jgi:hypothetical protein
MLSIDHDVTNDGGRHEIHKTPVNDLNLDLNLNLNLPTPADDDVNAQSKFLFHATSLLNCPY